MQKEHTAAGHGKSSSDNHKETPKPVKNREDALDDALEETFPASDPVSIVPEKPEKPQKPEKTEKAKH